MTKQVIMETPIDAAALPDGPDWLTALRRDALHRFQETGWPHAKDEAWRNTDVQAFAEPLPRADADAARDAKPDLGPHRFEGIDALAVLVDGVFRPELSTLDPVEGLEVLSLREACAADRDEARVHLEATRPEGVPDVFAERNTALWHDGLFVNVLPGARIEAPLHILHLHTQADAESLPRVLVHVQDGSAVTVLEHFVGTGRTLALTELHAHPDATIDHDAVQEQDGDARVLHTVRATVEKDARVAQNTLHEGGRHARTTLTTRLTDTGAEADLHGLMLAADSQRQDCWTRVDHAAPHGTSRQLYKAILDDKARTGFTGNIIVRHGADGTRSDQENRNLLLSRGALADATPQLEIHADDVQCNHGSTVGQLDDAQLFFLRSRGIGADEATAMLTKAFAGEVVEALSVEPLRAHVRRRIDAWFARKEASS